MSDITEYELAGLSDAERDALEAEEFSEQELQDLLDDDEVYDHGDGDPESDDETDEDDGEEDEAPRDEPRPEKKLVDPASYSDDIAGINSALKKLKESYSDLDSDLTLDDYEAKRDELIEQRVALEKQQAAAAAKLESHQDSLREGWQKAVSSFFKSAKKADGVDYDADEKLYKELDRTVKWLANDPDNARQDYKWFLREAHRMVLAKHSIPIRPDGKQGREEPPEDPMKSSLRDEIGKRKAKSGNLPKSLSNVPEAGRDDSDEGGEFSYLDNLTGLELEREIAKMSPEKMARYERV